VICSLDSPSIVLVNLDPITVRITIGAQVDAAFLPDAPSLALQAQRANALKRPATIDCRLQEQ